MRRHISYCSDVPTATSKFRNERNPVVPQAILIGDQKNHYVTLPDALMPYTPVCNEMYEAGLMNPAVADRIWYTYKCNLKLAVTMFKSEELECCINSLSARRLVVPKPAPASSTVQTIWLLTQAQMDMGTVAQAKIF